MEEYLNASQIIKFNRWKKTFGKLPYIGATGGHFGLEIIFTSIGNIIKAKSWNGKTLDLTEYDSF